MSKQFYLEQFGLAQIRSVNAKNSKLKPRFSSIQPIDRILIRCNHFVPEWTWRRWQRRGTLHSPKFQHYWSLTIRLLSVISRTLVGWGLIPLQRSSWCILQPQPTGQGPRGVLPVKIISINQIDLFKNNSNLIGPFVKIPKSCNKQLDKRFKRVVYIQM